MTSGSGSGRGLTPVRVRAWALELTFRAGAAARGPLLRPVTAVLQAGSVMPGQVGGLLDFLFHPHLRLGTVGTQEGTEF